ncbi:MAG: hypothetical protein Q9166_002321 [cf. Caloplaca sp. 2 TL-2023]
MSRGYLCACLVQRCCLSHGFNLLEPRHPASSRPRAPNSSVSQNQDLEKAASANLAFDKQSSLSDPDFNVKADLPLHSSSFTRDYNSGCPLDFAGHDDFYRPINWPIRKKVITTILYGFTIMGSTWTSSVYSPAMDQISEKYDVSAEVSLLGLSVLLIGLGPLVWAPLSKVYGHKPAVLAPHFLAAIFSSGTATVKDIQAVIITRFFADFLSSATFGLPRYGDPLWLVMPLQL